MNYLKLNDIQAYTTSFQLSNLVWQIVIKWKQFEKDTIGKQYVRAIDSISANLAEGFGRYTKKDKIKFYRYSFGSLTESQDWTQKAITRKLLTQEQHQNIIQEIQKLPYEINTLIKYTNDKLKI